MNYLDRIIIASLLITLTACSSPTLVVRLKANKHLNPDITNQSLPVEVIVYQLRDRQTFSQATFNELWHDDKNTLGASFISRDEVNIIPGSKNKITINRDNATTYIGIMAIFRNPNAGHWRLVKKIGHKIPLHSSKIDITLTNYSIVAR